MSEAKGAICTFEQCYNWGEALNGFFSSHHIIQIQRLGYQKMQPKSKAAWERPKQLRNEPPDDIAAWPLASRFLWSYDKPYHNNPRPGS